MSTLIIRKKSLKTWLHTDSILGDFIISKFYFNADNGNFQVVEQGQSRRVIYNVTDITLYDDTDGGVAETFANITALSLRLEELNYPAFQYDGQIVSIANLIEAGTNVTITGDGTTGSPYVINSSGGGGGGAVTSVNSDTGAVIVDLQSATDEGNETTNDVIFRLDANNYIELDTADQTFKIYSDVFGSLDPTEVLTNIDAGGAIFKNLSNTAEFVGIGQGVISIKDTASGNFVVLSKDKLAMYDDSNTLIGEYAYPTGATSQIATLLDLAGKQDTLVSGTNIKTINGTSVLGSGDISIGGAGATQNARATRLELTGNISLPMSVGGSVTVIDFDNTVLT